MKKYDLLVIGFGKAGKTLAIKFATLGKKVAIIEKDSAMYGGTCINIGCIPTKTMIVASEKSNDYSDIKNIRDSVVTKLNAKNFNMLNSNDNIDVYTAHAKFISNNVVEINHDKNTTQINGDIIVINTGATPIIPNIEGILSTKNVYDSTQFQSLKSLPKNIAIIGGGNIGLEFASLYAKLGSKVTIFEPSNTILQREDKEIADLAKQYLEESGITFNFNTSIIKVENQDDKVVLTSNNQNQFVVDAVLYATGRKPNIDELGLNNTDIEITNRGAIKVDTHCETSVKNIFAVGDVNGGAQFTYTSLDDYRIVYNYLTKTSNYNLSDRKNVPYTIFITPALSRVGMSEKEALEKGFNIATKSILVSNMPRGIVNQDTKGIFKAIVDKDTNLILGATLFSKNSEELINIIKMAMDNHIPYTYIRDQIFNHPNMAENLNDLFNL